MCCQLVLIIVFLCLILLLCNLLMKKKSSSEFFHYMNDRTSNSYMCDSECQTEGNRPQVITQPGNYPTVDCVSLCKD